MNQNYYENQSITKKWTVIWKSTSELVVLASFRKFGWNVTKVQVFKNWENPIQMKEMGVPRNHGKLADFQKPLTQPFLTN